MKTLVLANQKGGVGKSAISTQLAYYFHKSGLRTLFVDLDHQRNASKPITASKLATITDYTATQLLRDGKKETPGSSFVLVPADDNLSGLERDAALHNTFASNLNGFLKANEANFDVCIIDTNPNPDIRYASSLVVADYALSPVQLNQEALDGIAALLNHKRYGITKIKAAINTKLELIGILPNMVEPTPFQRENFKQLIEHYANLLIVIDAAKQKFAYVPKRVSIAEAQAAGVPLYDLKKTAAREAWAEIKPSFDIIATRMKLEIKNA